MDGPEDPLDPGPWALHTVVRERDNILMFVRSFAEVERPFEAVRSLLLDRPERWLPGLATDAGHRGEQLLAEVGFGSEHTRVDKRVLIKLRAPMEFPSRFVLPMEWRPVSARNLLPKVEGDLEIAALGPRRTHVSLSARYRPPLGVVGRALDRALLHRVAEATVKDFVDGVAAAFHAELIAG